MPEGLPPPRSSIAGDAERVTREIADFERSIERWQSGRIPDPVFLEHRLRFGVYGQRQDGVHMMRSKLPLGLLSPDGFDAMADIAEGFGAGVAHLTTRQDIQVHFIALEKSPEVMRVLAAAEATSREACGNVVRNVVCSPASGVLPGEAFDVTPHGMALARFLLRHPDGQALGRKFKVSLASSPDPRFDLAPIHDIGVVARLRGPGESGERGFRVRVGGGLGAVPHEAPVLYEFLPEAELLPLAHAVLRVFAEHGEKENRNRARLKFLVARWGIERFREEVERQRASLADTPEWTTYLGALDAWDDAPLHPPGELPSQDGDAAGWLATNVHLQRQDGYALVRVRVPRGDLDPGQLRGIAAVLRAHCGDTARLDVDQSILLRWVPLDRLLQVREALVALGLGEAGAGGLSDPVTCPGADTCKLGVTSPRTAAGHLAPTLERLSRDAALAGLTVKISGCPNGCAQHHIADLGFFGGARTSGGVTAPIYLVLVGGAAGGNGPGVQLGDGFGQVIGKVPAVRVPETVERLTALFLELREDGERFGAFVRRVGRARMKEAIAELTRLPPPEEAPELYREHGQEASFAMDRGVGECAGEFVDPTALAMVEADQSAERAEDLLHSGAAAAEVAGAALDAMHVAARTLLSTEGLTDHRSIDVPAEFRRRFYETGRIFEGVGHYYLAALEAQAFEGDALRRLVAEAGLFVEEVHATLGKVGRARLIEEGKA